MERDFAAGEQLPLDDVAWLVRTAIRLNRAQTSGTRSPGFERPAERRATSAARNFAGRGAVLRTIADAADHLRVAAIAIGVVDSGDADYQPVARHVRPDRFVLPAFVGKYLAVQDPLIAPLLRMSRPGSTRASVRSSSQLETIAGTRDVGKSAHTVAQIAARTRAGLGSSLYGLMPLHEDRSALVISLHRTRRDRTPWSPRETMILQLLLPEIASVIDAGKRRRQEPIVPLSPRQEQTLALLLRGQSEKQIGLALKLSLHTVHAYVKSIYKAFHVSSRAELLAKLLT